MWIVSWDPFLMKKLFKSEICWSVNSAWCALINWNCLTSQTLRQLFMYSAWTVSVTVKFVPKCVKKKKNRKTQMQTQMPDPNVALHVSYASILQYVFNFGVCFLQLLLMKRGGQVSYAGPLGRNSHKLIEYFEVSIFFHVCSLFFLFLINVCSLLNQMVRVFPYF